MGFGMWPVYQILNENTHLRATGSFLCWYDGGKYPMIYAYFVLDFHESERFWLMKVHKDS